MSVTTAVYVLAISVGTWIIGLGFGIILGVRLPQRVLAWRQGIGFVVFGSFLTGLILVLFLAYGRQGR